jgi:hypothetical protein
MSRLSRAALLSGVLLIGLVAPVAAQEPIDPPAGFAEVRATFEPMTRADWEAAGYIANPPACIASPAGGMGIHAMNMALFEAQFTTGAVDAANPPILLVDATQTRVIGLEWETAEAAGPFTIFGQTAPLLAGHPGIPEPHYMLHAYFRPNGQVLFAEFDPEVTCPAVPNVAMVPRDRTTTDLAVLGLTLVGLAGLMAARKAVRSRTG